MVTRATVTRLSADGPYVVLAGAAGTRFELGPCVTAETPTPLAAGDDVLVAWLDGRPDEVAIIARLP